jgi:hypothetical protein
MAFTFVVPVCARCSLPVRLLCGRDYDRQCHRRRATRTYTKKTGLRAASFAEFDICTGTMPVVTAPIDIGMSPLPL